MTDGAHISDLRWDRLLAGDLAAEDASRARAHAEHCPSCGDRLRELSAARDAFAERPISMSFVPPRRSRRGLWVGGGALVMAAAAVLLVVVRPGNPPGERPKGTGPSLIIAASRHGVLVPLATGDGVQPGDAIQVGYSSDRDGFGAVISRDGAGVVTTYVPSHGAMLVALPAGTDRPFPESTILDAVVGTETLHVVWCETGAPLEPLLAEVRRGEAHPRPGCTYRTVVLEKSAP